MRQQVIEVETAGERLAPAIFGLNLLHQRHQMAGQLDAFGAGETGLEPAIDSLVAQPATQRLMAESDGLIGRIGPQIAGLQQIGQGIAHTGLIDGGVPRQALQRGLDVCKFGFEALDKFLCVLPMCAVDGSQGAKGLAHFAAPLCKAADANGRARFVERRTVLRANGALGNHDAAGPPPDH